MPDVTVAKVMQKMVDYLRGDAKRIHHAIKVHSLVRNIALLSNLKRDKLTVLEITALLHDIGIPECERKYNSTAGHYQEMEGPASARKLLEGIALKGMTGQDHLLDRPPPQLPNDRRRGFQILIEPTSW